MALLEPHAGEIAISAARSFPAGAAAGAVLVTAGVVAIGTMLASRQGHRKTCSLAQVSVPCPSAMLWLESRSETSALRWYEHLLDETAFRPMKEVGEFRFERGGSLQVSEDSKRAGASSVTLAVTDLDEQLDDLKRRAAAHSRRLAR